MFINNLVDTGKSKFWCTKGNSLTQTLLLCFSLLLLLLAQLPSKCNLIWEFRYYFIILFLILVVLNCRINSPNSLLSWRFRSILIVLLFTFKTGFHHFILYAYHYYVHVIQNLRVRKAIGLVTSFFAPYVCSFLQMGKRNEM